ncbi:hypothetical protein AMECASPLE_031898 [Ameca splendens]|uniref:Secreted protein n=1 Tax=Ameca splendens TaxID=208324 RepID=A0ABV0ZGA4_9TELE
MYHSFLFLNCFLVHLPFKHAVFPTPLLHPGRSYTSMHSNISLRHRSKSCRAAHSSGFSHLQSRPPLSISETSSALLSERRISVIPIPLLSSTFFSNMASRFFYHITNPSLPKLRPNSLNQEFARLVYSRH